MHGVCVGLWRWRPFTELRCASLLWPQEVCLHALVAGRRDTAVLLAAVRKLPPPLVLALLTYLRKWVERQAGVLPTT